MTDWKQKISNCIVCTADNEAHTSLFMSLAIAICVADKHSKLFIFLTQNPTRSNRDPCAWIWVMLSGSWESSNKVSQSNLITWNLLILLFPLFWSFFDAVAWCHPLKAMAIISLDNLSIVISFFSVVEKNITVCTLLCELKSFCTFLFDKE